MARSVTEEVVYPDDRRPACTVRVGDRWYVGEIARWRRQSSGWSAVVCYFETTEKAFMRTVGAEDVCRLEAGDGDLCGPWPEELVAPTRALRPPQQRRRPDAT